MRERYTMVHDDDCVFCRIISGELDSAAVYEDDSALAFLDLRQSNEGHVLVVPKNHFEQIYDLDEHAAAALASAVCKVARAVRRVYAPDGLSIWQSNGPAAFQEIPHVHWHIFPRYTDDGHLVVYPKNLADRARREYSLQSLKDIAGPLKSALQKETA
ncbi:MAG: HIT family protein [Gemmatimonadetes bacterium]|nr:HIT family protein [Gemmatimonadota bacterium]MYG83938.1 HIT family protein [Gemmatimonadota bacterium]MYJ91126.1 HIT family protein [Gemmatimonadota bacterium]